jgi:branched-chain amino acid transport system substrate-binding protein
MRKWWILAAVAVVAVAAAGAAFATAGASSPAKVAGPAAADAAVLKCGRVRTLGFAAPLTGDAASLGQQMSRWADFFVKRYNRGHSRKIRLVKGDTQLPNTAQAIKVAQQFASNSKILGVVGPAGSQEVVASTAPLRKGGLVFVSGTATRTSLTADRSRRGYFYRTVPNDDQQGARAASYIATTLKKRRVFIIDDEETYSQGLADKVQQLLRARSGFTVTRDHVSQSVSDFSSLVARIPSNTQLVYIPWQLAPKAQIFAQQLRSAGKRATVFGSDGTFAPGTFKFVGAYMTSFPVDLKSSALAAYKRAHGGKSELFGLPTYVAAQIVTLALDKACKNGSATRAEVRRLVAKTNLRTTLLGFQVRFAANGEMRSPADFAVYKIAKGGVYQRVA